MHKHLLILLASLALCAVAVAAPPNFVIIYADDMGWGDLGAQNPESKIPTPHLDRLAREGTRFTDAHSSSGICTPSRYALLHGRYHWRKFHDIVHAFGQPVLDVERTTLAELLRERGYRTACIGKWHLGWDWNAIKKPGAKPVGGKDGGFAADAFDWSRAIPGGPLAHGFDTYFGDDVPNFPPYAWFENDRVVTAPSVPREEPGAPAEGEWEARPGPAVPGWDFAAVMPRLTERAEQFIRAQKAEQPFFLYFACTSPHTPIVPAKEFAGRSGVGGYGDYMAQTDDTVGRLLAALVQAGVAENTLVIFSSDNGPERYAYARVGKTGHRSSGPLRGLKRDLYEGGHRVPFVVRWPGKVPAARVSDALLSQMDIYATVAALAGAKIPAGSAGDSRDQSPLWLGGDKSARDTLVHNTNPDHYAIRHGDWLLVAAKSGAVTKVPADRAAPENPHPGELFNLRDDLAQTKNLYAEKPEIVAELTARLAALRAREITP